MVTVKCFAFSSLSFLIVGLGACLPPYSSSSPTQVRQDAPNVTLTATGIASHCRAAYAALTSYDVTSNVTAQAVSADGTGQKYQTSAVIQFVRPGHICTKGKDMGGNSFAYVSDSTRTAFRLGSGPWKSEANPEMAIAGATGISASAGATVPALLFGSNWGTPLPLGSNAKPRVREYRIAGRMCYILTAHLNAPDLQETESDWIDEETFLLRRSVTNYQTSAKTYAISGQTHAVPAMRMHSEQDFTLEKRNPSIPESVFIVPAVQ